MDNFLIALIESTKRNTSKLVESGKVPWASAREGVVKVFNDLMESHPQCAADIKTQLEPWIARLDAEKGFSQLPASNHEDHDLPR